MRVLISGAGIAGPTLAYWLLRYGIEPTIVEKSPRLRTGGYVIDFWGAGYDVAERMGIQSDLNKLGYRVNEVRVVDEEGKRVSGFPVKAFSRITHGRYVSIARGDLAAAIFRQIENRAQTVWGDGVESIEQGPERVQVLFESGRKETFDLVVGTDGLHSRVRQIAFGEDAQFEKYLGYKVAAFEARGYRPRDELVYVMYTQIGQQVGRFSMRDDASMFLFIFADGDPHLPSHLSEQKAVLHDRFHASGWECPRILDALDSAETVYFDRVSQIRLNADTASWSRGRVTLAGDAAACVSLLAGQGSALAMTAAYVLAGELSRSKEDPGRALVRYQKQCAPLIRRKQESALRFAGSFAPKSAAALFFRNLVMNLFQVPLIAKLAFGREFTDRLPLPDY